MEMTNLIIGLLLFGCNQASTFSQGQNQTNALKDTITSEPKDVITSYGPSNIVRSIIQDSEGNIWMASWEGIFRYDGKSFTNITSKVSSARFFSILEDKKGNFWFGTIGSGAYCYDGKSFKNFSINEGLLNNEVGSIYEDKKGNIWFGVSGGASCFDGKSFHNFIINDNDMNEDWTGKTFPGRQPYEVNSIVEDKKGKFWFATRGNTFVYDPSATLGKGGKIFTVFTHDDKPFKNVRTIMEDKKGNIWLSGSDGLWCYNDSTFTNFNQSFVGFIIEDKKGNLWTSSEKDRLVWSLSKYDEKTLLNNRPTVTEIANQPMIFGILEDDKGNIWFGSNGVYRYNGKTITDFKSKEDQK
jgi:ligand-binding sensor domain-containing protein